MQHIASVGHLNGNIVSLMLKRLIFPKRIKEFKDLDKAVEWALNISKKPAKADIL